MNILMLEDDPAIAQGLRYSLESEGYTVTHCATVTQALEAVGAGRFDLCLLDLTLPDGSGYDVCKAIKAKDDTPVIFLTAFDDEVNVVMGLELGADDYVVKPFDAKEVVARVKAVLRRTQGKNGNTEESKKVVTYDKLEINIANYELKVNGVQIDTPPKELELIYHFASNPNRVFTRDQLLDEVWGFEFYGDSRTVDVHVKRLREKLEGVSDKWELKTVWGVGYKFETKE